jgi:hypothetical protein
MAVGNLAFDDFLGEVGIRSESYDKIDMSPMLAAVLFESKQLMGIIGFEDPAENIIFEHLEDYVIPGTIVGDFTTATDAITFQAADNPGYTMAQLLRQTGGANYDEGVVLAADDGSFAVRIVKNDANLAYATGYVITTDYVVVSGAIPTGDTADITFRISLPYSDEEDASNDISLGRTHRYGSVRIFERAVEIAKTRQSIDLYALSAEDRHQINLRTIEMGNELANSIINEAASLSGGQPSIASARRNMTGIRQQLNDPDLDGSGETNQHVTSAATTYPVLQDDLETAILNLYNAGAFDAPGADHAIVINPVANQFFSNITSGDRRAMYDYRKAGYSVQTYHSTLGIDFPIVLDRFWPTLDITVLDLGRVRMRQLQGDGMNMEKMGRTGRREKWQLSGQYGVSVKNVQTSHSRITGHTIAAYTAAS